VLINLGGHTRGSDPVTLVFARRPAPVQLMHEGYAGTMGGARHTAHITDRLHSMERWTFRVRSRSQENAERESGWLSCTLTVILAARAIQEERQGPSPACARVLALTRCKAGRYSSPPDYAGHYVEKLLYMPHAFFVNDHRQVYLNPQPETFPS